MFQSKSFEKTQKGRNHLIDLLRIIAATGVVLFHLNEPIPYINNFYRDFCKLGFLGVPLFFIISGYCIRIAENHSKSGQQFLVRRLFRIYLPYWFSLLLVLFCAIFIKLITGTNSTPLPKDFSGIVATIGLYTTPLSNFKTINWVYWTLPYEIFFYLIIGLLIFLGETAKRILLIILLIIALILPPQTIGILFFFNELPTFLLGYMLYLLLNKKDILTLSMFLLAGITLIFKHQSIEYIIVCMIVCLLIFIDKIKPLKNNFFSNLGDYSYSIYLIHVPIGIYVLGFVKSYKIVQMNEVLNFFVDLSILSLITVISKFTFEFIELKSIEVGKKISNWSS